MLGRNVFDGFCIDIEGVLRGMRCWEVFDCSRCFLGQHVRGVPFGHILKLSRGYHEPSLHELWCRQILSIHRRIFLLYLRAVWGRHVLVLRWSRLRCHVP